MSEDLTLYNRRWYDQIANVTMALHVSRQLPQEVQRLIAGRLNDAIDDTRRLQRGSRGVLSLGQGRVLGLYQASSRQRWYDEDPTLHRAFTMMTGVSETFLTDFAGRVVNAGHYLNEQPSDFRYAYPDLVSDTLDGILRRQTVSLESGEDGIRLVMDNPVNGEPEHPRHVVPLRPRKRSH